jgi:response regulator RpfG family c-di-GMP phosphodiesterase
VPAKVLFVDDDELILQTYQRQLHKRYRIDIALGADPGLAAVNQSGPYAVIVSDMRMPGMDGIQFLTEVRRIAPDSVRMVLSGYADMQSAIEAVNEGNIFRFLTKPCTRELLVSALDAGIAQYHLITAERELLSKTLSSSVKVLVDILALVNPTAFGRTARVRQLVRRLAAELEADVPWQSEIAALLCQIGCVAVSDSALAKAYSGEEMTPEELQAFQRHPQLGRDLIATIPRMEEVAEIVGYQDKRFDGSGFPRNGVRGEMIPMGARILKVALDFDALVSSGAGGREALDAMRSRQGWYDPDVLAALVHLKSSGPNETIMEVSLQDLPTGAIVAEEVRAADGTVVIAKGLEVTASLRERLKARADSVGICEPIKIHPPSDAKLGSQLVPAAQE